MKYIIGNWKSNKSFSEAKNWLHTFFSKDFNNLYDVKIIICPPYPFIPFFYENNEHKELVEIGSQDISFFGSGSYTGEVSAHCMQSIVSYSIIGHSERRSHFKETDAIVDQKIKNALDAKIEPIICVRNEKDVIPDKITYVAYEPVEAIGTGNNELIDNVLLMKKKLFLKDNQKFIYGGSINQNNAAEYLQHDEVDGALVGGASLDPNEFYNIILTATIKKQNQ